MKNRVLLLSGNFYPEPTGIGKYSGEMIDWLSENDFSCTVITTFPYYPEWRVNAAYTKRRFWFKKEVKEVPNANPITVIRCPHYIPGSPTGAKRLLSDITIWFSSYLAIMYLIFGRKYHYVISIAPPFELGLLGILYKRIRGAVSIYHIQDLQIDAAQALGMIKSRLALKTLYSIEKQIIDSTDHISTISNGMLRKVSLKSDKQVILFPNWVKTDVFFPLSNQIITKTKLGFSEKDRIVLYSGAIGVKQGLETVIYAAQALQDSTNIKFVICGSGPYKDNLQLLSTKLSLLNVIYLPTQPISEMNSFLNMADLHLVIQKSDASDLVMPSKLSTILSVGGVPIVSAEVGSELFNILQTTNIGITIQPESPDALVAGIQYGLNVNLEEKAKNAREYALKHLSCEHVLKNFMQHAMNRESNARNNQSPSEALAS